MKPLGDMFIQAIKMVIAPIIFCTVVHGIAGMKDMKKVGRVGLKAIVYFELVTTLALVVGLVIANLWKIQKPDLEPRFERCALPMHRVEVPVDFRAVVEPGVAKEVETVTTDLVCAAHNFR